MKLNNTQIQIGFSSLTINTCFQNHYVVPDYQREYVWDQPQVEQLLSDLTDAFLADRKKDYTVTYSDKENKKYVYSGKYDPAADALTCTVATNGAESTSSEYRKTTFGYTGQYYFLNEDGTTSIYMIAVDGEDGIIGISTTPGKPAALTGSEAADFPKACSEWYSVKGTTITGKTSDGLDLSFEYVPAESSSN